MMRLLRVHLSHLDDLVLAVALHHEATIALDHFHVHHVGRHRKPISSPRPGRTGSADSGAISTRATRPMTAERESLDAPPRYPGRKAMVSVRGVLQPDVTAVDPHRTAPAAPKRM